MTDNPSTTPSSPSTPDIMARVAQMEAELARLRRPPEPQNTNALLEQLVQRLDGSRDATAQATNEVLQQLVTKLDSGKGKKIWIDKPDKFDGKIGDKVENWLKGWELWFEHRENQDGAVEERTKIDTAMLGTMETVQSSLGRYERKHGKWTTWQDFKRYMKAKYTSTDSFYAGYLKLERVTQRDGETVDSYYERFTAILERQKFKETDAPADEADGNDERKEVNDYINCLFIKHILPTIRADFLRLPEAKDFQWKDLHELRGLATRVEESISHGVGPGAAKHKASSSGPDNVSPKPNKKFRKSRDTDEVSRDKLKYNERTFLNNNIAKGGGTYIFPSVQKKFEWIFGKAQN